MVFYIGLEWPEEDEMSGFMKQTIDALLNTNPDRRSNGQNLRKMSLFRDIPWEDLLSIEPPFIPQPDSEDDTSYFRSKWLSFEEFAQYFTLSTFLRPLLRHSYYVVCMVMINSFIRIMSFAW